MINLQGRRIISLPHRRVECLVSTTRCGAAGSLVFTRTGRIAVPKLFGIEVLCLKVSAQSVRPRGICRFDKNDFLVLV
jgi:hypothetical protein